MWHALGPVLPLAAAEALGPVSVGCAVVMLMGGRGRQRGLAYLAGWVVGIAVVGGVVLALAGSIGAGERGNPAAWVSWLKLVAAVVLVVVAVVIWRQHHRTLAHLGGKPATPAWLRAADRAQPWQAVLLGAVNGSVNPVNAVMVGSAALTISHEGLASEERIGALVLYILLASLGVATPVVLCLARGEQARGSLDRLRRWLIDHQSAILVVLCLGFAAKLTGDALPHLDG